MKYLKVLLTSISILVLTFGVVGSAYAQKRSTKVPNYLADTLSKALSRITLREVAGSYVKIEYRTSFWTCKYTYSFFPAKALSPFFLKKNICTSK